MKSYVTLIFGMAMVTYIPRLFPMLFLTNKRINPKTKLFLQYIPYTSLSILIIRGIITSSKEMMIPSIIGIGISGLIAHFDGNLVLSVLIGILASFIAIQILA